MINALLYRALAHAWDGAGLSGVPRFRIGPGVIEFSGPRYDEPFVRVEAPPADGVAPFRVVLAGANDSRHACVETAARVAVKALVDARLAAAFGWPGHPLVKGGDA